MKKLMMILGVLSMFLFSAATVSAQVQPTVRVAQLPIELGGNFSITQKHMNQLDQDFYKSLEFASDGHRESVEFITMKESQTALKEVVRELAGKSDPESVLVPLANKLNADIVIMPELNDFQQHDYMNLDPSYTTSLMYTYSYTAFRIVGYDRTKNEIFHESTAKTYDYEQSSIGTADNLVKDCMDEVLQESDFVKRVVRAEKK